MSMLEILNKENTLQKEQPYKIHFFMENGGWWRAYELSAFLCYEMQKNMGEGNQLKVSKKFIKNYGEYVFVGLKLQSFNKYFPNMNIETMLEELDDKHITIPIGNLTSQLFSNVFLNELDQFVKRTLKCKHYGRYVDDAYIVSPDKQFLKNVIPKIKKFLEEELQLKLHMGKTHIIPCKNGVEFLGAFIRPYRTYISHACLNRIKSVFPTISDTLPYYFPLPSINSFLGILRHYSTFNIRVLLFGGMVSLYDYGYFDTKLTKFILNNKTHKMSGK